MRLNLLLCFAVMASACGGIDLDEYESKLLEAACKNAVTCKQMPDVATCKAATNTKTRYFQTLVAKAKAKVIKYDSDKAEDCASDVESQSCSFDGFYGGDSPCQEVFTGTVAANGACTIDQECAGDANCVQNDANCDSSKMCCPGTCKPNPTPVAIGGDCTNAPCVDNSYCNAMNKCAALITMSGATCDDFLACANPMYCDLFANTPTCVTPAAHGATCDVMATIACADGRDYCDATTLKCTSLVAPSQACEGANGAECIGYADCVNMVCVARLAANASCDTSMGSSCLGDLDCVSSKCSLPAPEAACARELGQPPLTLPPPTTARRTARDRTSWIPKPDTQRAQTERALRAWR